jgi:hypothetical protein
MCRAAWERCEPGKAVLNVDTATNKNAAAQFTEEVEGAISGLDEESYQAAELNRDP